MVPLIWMSGYAMACLVPPSECGKGATGKSLYIGVVETDGEFFC